MTKKLTLVLGLAALVSIGPLAAQAPAVQAKPAARQSANVARAQELIDAGKPEQALPLLDQQLANQGNDAAALLLRSTARFLTGDLAGGKKDLERSLAIDPKQRQAWLNRGALDLSEKRYDRALEAFLQGEKLDPSAPDNDLNLGAVLLLQGKLQDASTRFRRYLDGQRTSAEAHYLVASNYALAGYAALAVQTLRGAVEIDERMRQRARTDLVFANLEENEAFHNLLATDGYRLPLGAHSAKRTYDLAYSEDGRLVGAVIEAMRAAGEKFDPTFEASQGWTLLWGDLRIKVSGEAGKPGLVEMSALVERMTDEVWQRRTEKLFKAIDAEVAKVKASLPKATPKPKPTPKPPQP